MRQILFKLTFISTFFFACKDKKQNSETHNKNFVDTKKLFKEIGLIKPQKIEVTSSLQDLIKEKIDSIESMDFNGDKIQDFICKTKPNTDGIGIEYWVLSNLKIVKQNKYTNEGYHFRWFINLDKDPALEILEAIGDEDGIDYTISKQNLSNGIDSILLYINPIIIEENKNFWGYPWDILNIKAQTNGEITQLYCSLNHKIIRDGNEENNPKNQKQIPIIFFNGHHTQESEQSNIQDEKWLTLKEIVELVKR